MRIFQVDAFTDAAFTGNPAAVCLLDRAADPRWMQQLAAEMNLAETVFLFPPQDGGDVVVRIFTPGAELPFAGSPVLGTAFVVGAAHSESDVRLTVEAVRESCLVYRKALENGIAGYLTGRSVQPVFRRYS